LIVRNKNWRCLIIVGQKVKWSSKYPRSFLLIN